MLLWEKWDISGFTYSCRVKLGHGDRPDFSKIFKWPHGLNLTLMWAGTQGFWQIHQWFQKEILGLHLNPFNSDPTLQNIHRVLRSSSLMTFIVKFEPLFIHAIIPHQLWLQIGYQLVWNIPTQNTTTIPWESTHFHNSPDIISHTYSFSWIYSKRKLLQTLGTVDQLTELRNTKIT